MVKREEVLPKLRQLNCLFSDSHGKTVAHCLDLDVVATGDSLLDASQRLAILMKAHIESALAEGNYSNLATPAPNSYWEKYNEGNPITIAPGHIEIRVPEIVPMTSPNGTLGVTARQLAHVA